jgi:photosystem II stability/assembly factor-like uncharacterized protein
MFAHLIAVLGVLSVALGAEWALIKDTTCGAIVGVGAASKTAAIAAANSNSQGPMATLYDGDNWTSKIGVVKTALILDGAVTEDGKNAVYTSFSGMFVSSDSGVTFDKVPGLVGLSQDVHTFGSSSFGAVGSFIVPPGNDNAGSYQGIAFSTNNGADWSVADIPGETYPRYASFPSDSTWFVTAGMWNSTDSDATLTIHEHSEDHMRLSRGVQLGKQSKKHSVRGQTLQDGDDDGWYAKIYKTTDAGQTFKAVYEAPSDETWYFNQIDCPTESLCVAVGEGQSGSSPYAVALQSTDGGASWTKTFESTTYASLMSVVMTSATDGFIAPIASGRGMATDFLMTLDGGKTWTASQSLGDCYAIDVDSAQGLGVAACLSSSGSSGAIAMYQ